MRLVIWTDKNGYKHRSLVRDDDPDEAAPGGIRQEPPSLDNLDWEAVKLELHNRLMDAGLWTWQDVQRKEGLPGIILAVLRTRLINLYREGENG